MFQLTNEEVNSLRSQIVTSSKGGRRYLPYVFTEQGGAMLSSVLKSERAIEVNVEIMRVFVQMRHYALNYSQQDTITNELKRILLLHIENTETKLSQHEDAINKIAAVLNNLMSTPQTKRKPIGFMPPEKYAELEAEYEKNKNN
jgi:hypothetical protein